MTKRATFGDRVAAASVVALEAVALGLAISISVRLAARGQAA